MPSIYPQRRFQFDHWMLQLCIGWDKFTQHNNSKLLRRNIGNIIRPWCQKSRQAQACQPSDWWDSFLSGRPIACGKGHNRVEEKGQHQHLHRDEPRYHGAWVNGQSLFLRPTCRVDWRQLHSVLLLCWGHTFNLLLGVFPVFQNRF